MLRNERWIITNKGGFWFEIQECETLNTRWEEHVRAQGTVGSTLGTMWVGGGSPAVKVQVIWKYSVPNSPETLENVQVKLVISGLFFCISVRWFISGPEPCPSGCSHPGGDKLNGTSCLSSLLHLWASLEHSSQRAALKRQSDRWTCCSKFGPIALTLHNFQP